MLGMGVALRNRNVGLDLDLSWRGSILDCIRKLVDMIGDL